MLNVRQEPGSLKTPWKYWKWKTTLLSRVFSFTFTLLPYSQHFWHQRSGFSSHIKQEHDTIWGSSNSTQFWLSTWRQHQIPRVKGSCPPDCPNHTSDSKCKLGLLHILPDLSIYKTVIPTTSSGSINFLEQFTEPRKTIYLTVCQFIIKG